MRAPEEEEGGTSAQSRTSHSNRHVHLLEVNCNEVIQATGTSSSSETKQRERVRLRIAHRAGYSRGPGCARRLCRRHTDGVTTQARGEQQVVAKDDLRKPTA